MRGYEGANKFFNQNLQETQGIIILMDIAGFTKFCLQSNLENIQLLLRNFYKRMSQALECFCKYVEILKFIGDAIFAITKPDLFLLDKKPFCKPFFRQLILWRNESLLEKYKLGLTMLIIYLEEQFLYEGGIHTHLYSESNYYGPGVNAIFKLSKRLPKNYIYICKKLYDESINRQDPIIDLFREVYPLPEDIEPQIRLWAASLDTIKRGISL
jgi:hypothetical protein